MLLIVVDSLRRDRLGIYGHDRPTSPNVDTLARSGVVYTSAVSTAPWTTPSVASILSSRLPSTLGVRAGVALPDDANLLAEILASHGYATGAVISHSYIDAERNFDQGFDVFEERNVGPAGSVTSQGVSNDAIAFLRSRSAAGQPFFLFVHYFDPHFPYLEHPGFAMEPESGSPPYQGPVRSGAPWKELRSLLSTGRLGEEDARELLRIYDSEVAFTDAEIGRLLASLEEEGLAGETLVVLTSDHGEEFLDHGRLGHTRTLFDELIAVPLVVRYPASTASGRPAPAQPGIDDAPASLLDIVPTVLDVAGVEAAGPFAGTSLLESRGPDRPLYSETSRRASLRSVTARGFKLIEDRDAGATALFDLRRDAAETRDLWSEPEHAATRDALLAALARWPEAPAESAGPPVDVSAEERERLRALGYTGD